MKAAFEPPSDFVAPEKGGKKKIWMILGGGCLVVLLICGVLFAAGTFKAISCCNTLQDIAERSAAVRQFASGWATQVTTGDLDAAYQALSQQERAQISLADFKAEVAKHSAAMQGAYPQLFNIKPIDEKSISDAKVWRVSYQFMRLYEEQMLVLTFDVKVSETEEDDFEVENIDFSYRERVVAEEPPATEVINFHDEIQAGRYELAYGRMPREFKDATSMEAFKTFLDSEGSVLVGSELEITEVSYPSDGRATVMAIARKKDQQAVVQYELQSSPSTGLQMWQIVAISPTLTTDEKKNEGDGDKAGGVESDVPMPSEETPEKP